MALGIEITQVTPLYPSRIFIQWDLVNPIENGVYLFKIERSGSTNGPWTVLEASTPNAYNYIDNLKVQVLNPTDGKAHAFSMQTQIYYRITVTPPSGVCNQAVSEPHGLYPTTISPIQMGLRRKLRYEEEILWKRFNGVRLAVLKRRFWGPKCTDCYDPTTRTLLKDHCTTCYGTTFVGGYWNPVVTYGRVYSPENVQAQLTERDRKESVQSLITLLDVPLLQDLDLIIEVDNNKRHIIRDQKQTELRRKSVHQQVVTSMLQHDAIEYRIPVDLRTVPSLW